MEAVYDTHKRPLQDLRISVTDRCNFRCNYCMPAELFPDDFQFLEKEYLLSFEEITRLTKLFLSFGVRKVRLTGGEPLLRKDLPILIKQISSLEGINDIGLTTNGLLLGRHAKELKKAGLRRVNVSLDAIDSAIFAKMNGRNIGIEPILQSIQEAQEAGLLVKINTVIKKGLNESQILPMARYCKEQGIQLRYIEFMDVGCSNGWKLDEVVTSKEIRDMIHHEMPLEEGKGHYFGEVAKRYSYLDGQGEVGFISSVTETFCSSCTRARISADGKLYTCLFAGKGYDVRSILRSGASDEEVKAFVSDAWNKRSDRYSDERHENMKNNKKRDKIEMSYIGG